MGTLSSPRNSEAATPLHSSLIWDQPAALSLSWSLSVPTPWSISCLLLLEFLFPVGVKMVHPLPSFSPPLLCTSFGLLGPYLCMFFPKTKSSYEISLYLECPTLPLPYPLAISSKKFYLTPLPNLSSAVRPHLTSWIFLNSAHVKPLTQYLSH